MKTLLLALAWAILASLPHQPRRPEIVPCGTDWDCCRRNPAICRECDPDLYRLAWEKP